MALPCYHKIHSEQGKTRCLSPGQLSARNGISQREFLDNLTPKHFGVNLFSAPLIGGVFSFGGGMMAGDEKEVLIEILQRLTRLETKVDGSINAKEIAQEALQSTKSAHHRIDEVASDVKWAWRIAVGALITGAITFLWKAAGT